MSSVPSTTPPASIVPPAAPWLVCDVDAATGAVRVRGGIDPAQQYGAAWLLIRENGEPVRTVVHDLDGRSVNEVDIKDVAVSYSVATPPSPPRPEEAANLEYPPVSVVLCTRRRPESLARCLRGLAVQSHRGEVVVVDNDPADEAAVTVVSEFAAGAAQPIRYVREPHRGLSRARNTGVQAARYDHVAFIDDDEEVDPSWQREIARSFAMNPSCEVVTGPILPADLSTRAQVLFELFGGHSKGRVLARGVLTQDNVDPYFPQPAFGAGGNMSATRRALHSAGGFDTALGAGTRAGGGEDTLFFTEHLLLGGSIAYEPRALLWHNHYSQMSGLGAQLNGYRRGLTAFYAALLRERPAALFTMVKLLGPGLRVLRAGAGDADATDVARFAAPEDLLHVLRKSRAELVAGPWSYAAQRWSDRREQRR